MFGYLVRWLICLILQSLVAKPNIFVRSIWFLAAFDTNTFVEGNRFLFDHVRATLKASQMMAHTHTRTHNIHARCSHIEYEPIHIKAACNKRNHLKMVLVSLEPLIVLCGSASCFYYIVFKRRRLYMSFEMGTEEEKNTHIHTDTRTSRESELRIMAIDFVILILDEYISCSIIRIY